MQASAWAVRSEGSGRHDARSAPGFSQTRLHTNPHHYHQLLSAYRGGRLVASLELWHTAENVILNQS